MNVSFRVMTKRDIEPLAAFGVRDLPTERVFESARRHGFRRGTVITIDGCIVVAFAADGAVIYQDGSAAIPDLIRAAKRVWGAIGTLTYDDRDRIKRKGRPRPSIHDILKGATR